MYLFSKDTGGYFERLGWREVPVAEVAARLPHAPQSGIMRSSGGIPMSAHSCGARLREHSRPWVVACQRSMLEPAVVEILRWIMRTLSTFRLNLLRVFYLVLVIGLGMQMWPAIVSHVYSMQIDSGIVTCMLWALSVLSILGLRYPLQMLPLLLFEITWKTAWLLTVALPHWIRAQWNQDLASTTFAVSLVVIFLPLIPWSYVFEHYVKSSGDRWGRGTVTAP